MLAHARALHGDAKGERADYVEATIRKARAAVPRVGAPVPGDDETRAVLCDAIGRRDTTSTATPSSAGAASGTATAPSCTCTARAAPCSCSVTCASCFDRAASTRNATLATRTRFKAFTTNTATDVAQMVVQLCDEDEVDDRREQVRQWVADFIRDAGAEVAVEAMDTPTGRWEALVKADAAEDKLTTNHSAASRSAILRDEHGRMWLPAGALRKSVSPGAPSWSDLNALMLEAGWPRVVLDMHTPAIARGLPDSTHRRGVFFVEPGEATS